MRLVRAAGVVLALLALAAAGAASALLLLSTIGGAPADDPVGRLRPVVPGLDIGAAPTATEPVSTDESRGETTDDEGGDTTSTDNDRDERDDD